MKIIKESITDYPQEFFRVILGGWDGCDYVCGGYARTFSYENNGEFSLINLNEIFHDDLKKYNEIIDGNISPISFADVQKNVYACADNYGSGFSAKQRDQETLTEMRVKVFWEMFDLFFPHKTKAFIYQHDPLHSTFFDDSIFWFFCYIFLYEGKGIVIAADASD